MINVAIKKSFKDSKTFKYEFHSSSQRIVLFGPSGSGKTNLIKMIAGFLKPDEGIIEVNGKIFFKKNEKNLPIYKRNIGYLPQEYTLFPHMTVEENILYGVKIKNIKLNKKFYLNLLEKFNLFSKLNYYPNQLSGGEKQRVAFVRAILTNPNLFLFDEPFSSLDKAIKEKLRDAVIDILDEFSTKAIFVTHDFEDAFILGKEVFIIYNGQIIERGTADKIFNHPEYLETAKMVNFKNIFKVNEFAKIVKKEIKISQKFLGIKPENITFEKSNNSIPIKVKLKSLKKIGLIYEYTFLTENNKKLISISPELKNSEKVYVNLNSLVPLKELENENF